MNDLVHIASLLVQVLPGKRALTEAAILEFSGAEIAHGDERGRLIVTLEAPQRIPDPSKTLPTFSCSPAW
ncbi:chaperone NapD [Roseibium salinum]|nr:chaperone NapD [Roseibium salinum]